MNLKEKYIIVNSIPSGNLKKELCILNFNIIDVEDDLKKYIDLNPDTTFWCVTNDFSRHYIEIAAGLGIKNVVEYPIKTGQIENFFSENSLISQKEDFFGYEKLHNLKLLLVDDNELNITLLEDILEDLGISIYSFKNPMLALEEVNEINFDLCLLDILMPEMSGFELAGIIKKSELNKNTPIVFISAVSGNETIYSGYNLGACSYIEKPFSPKIVKAQIYNILKNQQNKTIKAKENDNFIAALTHDLKSPINAEILALKYMLNNFSKESNSEHNEILSDLLNSAQYMKLITDKILSYYRQKSSNAQLSKENASLTSIIISSIEDMRYLALDKNITIQFSRNDVNDKINVDVLEIKRVINNLISNAIEYSKENERIDIRLFNNDSCVICEIQDYGEGINLEKYKNIFDEYMTLSKEQKKTGFGLGLTICKSIILAHNGDIKISSKPNAGMKVSFNLPLSGTTEITKVVE